MPGISIVIRSLNEEKALQKLLPILRSQQYDGETELILVDNESHDASVEVARSFDANIVNLRRNDFSYPKSMNVGVAAATHEVVVLMVAHAYPFSNTWLADGADHFNEPAVAGVFANVIPYEGATQEELNFYMPNYEAAKQQGPFVIERDSMGVMGATNCIIRRSLWRQHPFDERYGLGGEDGEWAAWAMKSGYKIINDYRFSVRHLHALKDGGLEKQIEYWKSLGGPQPFDRNRLAFRDDISFD